MDLCIDETTWGFGGHGGSIVGNLINKQKNRGGQSVLLLDVGTMLPRGVIHRTKEFKKYEKWDIGPSEVRRIVEDFIMDNVGPDKLWPNGKPHITADNFFTHEKLLKWLGENGYRYLGTAARDKLWKKIDKKYFHSLHSKNISL